MGLRKSLQDEKTPVLGNLDAETPGNGNPEIGTEERDITTNM